MQPLMKSCLLVFPILKENPVILRFSSSPTFSVCLRRAMHAFSCRPDPPSPTFSALIHFDHCFRRLGALQCQRRPSLCDGVDDAGRGRAEGRSRRGDGVFDDGRAWRSMTPMHFRRAINRGCRRCRSLDNGRRPRPTRPDKISSPAAPRRRRRRRRGQTPWKSVCYYRQRTDRDDDVENEEEGQLYREMRRRTKGANKSRR